MTEEERQRVKYLIFTMDELISKYDYSDYYGIALSESVEAINCRVERVIGGNHNFNHHYRY